MWKLGGQIKDRWRTWRTLRTGTHAAALDTCGSWVLQVTTETVNVYAGWRWTVQAVPLPNISPPMLASWVNPHTWQQRSFLYGHNDWRRCGGPAHCTSYLTFVCVWIQEHTTCHAENLSWHIIYLFCEYVDFPFNECNL